MAVTTCTRYHSTTWARTDASLKRHLVRQRVELIQSNGLSPSPKRASVYWYRQHRWRQLKLEIAPPRSWSDRRADRHICCTILMYWKQSPQTAMVIRCRRVNCILKIHRNEITPAFVLVRLPLHRMPTRTYRLASRSTASSSAVLSPHSSPNASKPVIRRHRRHTFRDNRKCRHLEGHRSVYRLGSRYLSYTP